jgi:cell division protein FtsA
MNEKIITALDIGTSKIFGISGILRENGIEVIGAEVQNLPEDIVKKGRIADIEIASNHIFEILKSLKEKVGEKIDWVTIGIGGGHLKGTLYNKKMEIEPQGREIGNPDINYLKKEIKSSVIAANGPGKKVLYTVPQEYKIDDLNITKKEPVGMHGNTLEMKVHVITVDANPLQDIKNCVEEAGAQMESIYPHSWAVAEATLTEEEKNLGCLLIDIGKGTTDISLFSEGNIILTDSIKVGGGNLDIDLAKGLHTPVAFAEELKKNKGWCNYPHLSKEKDKILTEMVEIFNPSKKLSRKVTVEEISKIIYERMREIFEDFVKYRTEKLALLHTAGGGVVISGGVAKLKGIINLAEDIFKVPVRTAIPKNLFNLDESFLQPEFASGIGLLILASKQERGDGTKNIWQMIRKLLNRFF